MLGKPFVGWKLHRLLALIELLVPILLALVLDALEAVGESREIFHECRWHIKPMLLVVPLDCGAV